MFQPSTADEPPDDALADPADTRQAHLIELLTVCAQFLRTASPTVHKELRQFLTSQGNDPIAGLPAFLDALLFTVTRPTEQARAT
jgi:hypothetical protein